MNQSTVIYYDKMFYGNIYFANFKSIFVPIASTRASNFVWKLLRKRLNVQTIVDKTESTMLMVSAMFYRFHILSSYLFSYPYVTTTRS